MKTTCYHARHATLAILAAAMLCAATGVPAQTIHRHVDAQGRITYTDRAADGHVPQPQQRGRAMSRQRGAAIDAMEAERRLASAQKAREHGRPPGAGEHDRPAVERDAAAGEVTPFERYRRRQAVLERVVDQAQARVEETRLPLAHAPTPATGARAAWQD